MAARTITTRLLLSSLASPQNPFFSLIRTKPPTTSILTNVVSKYPSLLSSFLSTATTQLNTFPPSTFCRASSTGLNVIRRGHPFGGNTSSYCATITIDDCDCDWLPPQRIQNFNNERWTNRGRGDKNHWRFTLKENGLRFSTEQALYDYYVHILAKVLPSTAEAKKKIYIVTCEEPFGFGAEVDKITASKVVHFPEVEDCDEDNFYEARNKESNVPLNARFVPKNKNCRLENIFSYHYLSERNLEWDSDHWLINVTRVPNDKQGAAEIDEDTLNKLKALPDVLQVLPDYSFDLKGELYEELHLFEIENTMWRVLYIAGSQISTDYGYCND